MRLEKISENQIRVVISDKELKERDITAAELAGGSARGRECFADIMSEIRENYDFPFRDDAPLMIETMPASKRELVIVVSRIEAGGESFADIAALRFGFEPLSKDERKYAVNENAPYIESLLEPKIQKPVRTDIYEFNALDDVSAAAARIAENYNGVNALYKTNGKYYLALKGVRNAESRRTLCEFGRFYSHGELKEFSIAERGELILKQAVQKLKLIG